MRRFLLCAAVGLALVAGLGAGSDAAVPGVANCPVFPTDNVWHADVSGLPVHGQSGAWLASMGGGGVRLHPDFGPNGNQQPYGIPYTVVPGSHNKVNVTFDYADQSDPGPYPLGPDTPIEGGSDRHALMIDKDTCRLYELYDTNYSPNNSTAGSGAVFDLRSNALRPDTWTSADAAGLPVFAGLLRRDEVAAGFVDHAIRFTASRTDRTYLWPARHQAGAARDAALPPMGARFRLKASFDISRFRPDTQVVLKAMKRTGLILADNGSNWYFQGTSEQGWDEAFIDELKSVTAENFEAIDESSLMVDPNSGQVKGGAAPAPAPAPASAAKPASSATTAAPRPVAGGPATTVATPGAVYPEELEELAPADENGELASETPQSEGGQGQTVIDVRRVRKAKSTAMKVLAAVVALAGLAAGGLAVAGYRKPSEDDAALPEEEAETPDSMVSSR